MSGITGIGGIFLPKHDKMETLITWYEEVLELDVSDYGVNFLNQGGLPLISYHQETPGYQLNFTVQGLDDFLKRLGDKGVLIEGPVEELPYGRFVTIRDPFGQAIELCELKEEVYRNMVEGEIREYKHRHLKHPDNHK